MCAAASPLSSTPPMPRYKSINTHPQFLAIDLAQQLVPGTFEFALNHLLDHAIDLSHFDARCQNDVTGATAYPPALLLKVVLFAYSRGIVSSRAIARACEEQVTFIALCGTRTPHFTTIAHFVSTLGEDIARVFAAVLAVCDRQGLIGREMFAIDGVKLPSNASKHRSGTRADFARQADKLEAAAAVMLQRHRAEDRRPAAPSLDAATQQRVERLTQDAAELRTWLAQHPEDRRGARGSTRKSNRTDNESAKMATSAGVVQGYTGVAAVDSAHQIIVHAQAHGSGAEHDVLLPVVGAITPLCTTDTLLTADAGYHSDANLAALDARQRPALIADPGMRQRDARFATRDRYTALPPALHDKSAPSTVVPLQLPPAAFQYDPVAQTCVCPAGKRLRRGGRSAPSAGGQRESYRGTLGDCGPCALRDRCIRAPDRTAFRTVTFVRVPHASPRDTPTTRMRERIDSPEGRAQYGRRFATVEPVFANLRYNKRLTRFTLRGRTKVHGQWQLFCLVHNIEKLTNAGYAR
jgi:transposase